MKTRAALSSCSILAALVLLFFASIAAARAEQALPAEAINLSTAIALLGGWDLSKQALEILLGNNFVFADSMLDCINLVLHGKADGFYGVHSEINYLLRKNSLQDLKVFKVYNEGYSVAFFVRRDWPQLKSALHKALAAISREERAQLLVKWNAFKDDFTYRLKMLDLGPEERQWLKDHPVIRVGSGYRQLAGILQKTLDSIPSEQRNAAYQKWMTVSYEHVFDYSLLWMIVLPLLLALAVFAYWTRRLSREVSSRKRAEALLREAQKNFEQMNFELEARVRDRTRELEQTAQTLRESQERFKAIANNSPDAIITTDSAATILYCNSAAEYMFGYAKDELIGQSSAILLPERMQARKAMQGGSIIIPESRISWGLPLNHVARGKTERNSLWNFPFFAGKSTAIFSSAP